MEFLPFIKGFDIKQFNSAYQNKKDFNLDGTLISVIGYDDLRANKLALSRDVDIKDIIELDKIKSIKGK